MKKHIILPICMLIIIVAGALTNNINVDIGKYSQPVTIQTSIPLASPEFDVSVTASVLNVRSGPSVKNRKIGKYKRGTTVTVYNVKNGWYQVKYNGQIGYIASNYTAKKSTTVINNAQGKLVVTNDSANLRSGPGASYKYLGKVYNNSEYPIVGSGRASNGRLWYKISWKNSSAWVCSSFVKVINGNSAVEPKETPSSNKKYLGEYKITGYWASAKCGTKNGVIAMPDRKAQLNHTVAMCKDFPFETKIYIEGLGEYVVEDRGVGPNKVDVFVKNESEANAITGYYKVYIIE